MSIIFMLIYLYQCF
jgi:isocitrate dehydrogenase (NAD+)